MNFASDAGVRALAQAFGADIGALSNAIVAQSASISRLPASRVSLRSYGAVGDEIVDDAAAIALAVADARSKGLILDGEGLTYRIGSPLTAIPARIERLTLDARAITASLAWDIAGPAFEAEKLLTANAYQGGRQLNVTDHGYAVGDVLLARSDMVMETGTNSVCAHWAEVVAATSTTITLSHALLCNLLTANNARVQRLPKMGGVDLRDVRVLGSDNCPGGVQMARLYRPRVDGFSTENCKVRGLSLSQSFAPQVDNLSGVNCDRTGLGYAVNISGCGWADIGTTRGRRCRHVQTWGGAGTIPCIGGYYGDVIGSECLGSAMDTHPGAIGVQRRGTVLADMSPEYAAQDAITWQGVGGSVRARVTGHPSRHLCLVQPFHVPAAFQSAPDVDVDVSGDAISGQGVSVDVAGTGGLRSVRLRVSGNHSAESVFVKLANGSKIEALDIGGVATSGARAILVNQQTSGEIGSLSMRGRFRTTNPAVVAAQIIGPTDTAAGRTKATIAGLDVAGGDYGLRVDNRVDAKGATVGFLAGSTAASFTSGGGTVA